METGRKVLRVSVFLFQGQYEAILAINLFICTARYGRTHGCHKQVQKLVDSVKQGVSALLEGLQNRLVQVQYQPLFNGDRRKFND